MKRRILVVDDDFGVGESLKKFLQETGYEVLSAVDGDEAEGKFSSEAVDLMLLDLDLTKLNGWNVFGRISALASFVPIVVLSCLKDPSDSEMVPGVGAFLQKPLEVPVLLKTMEDLLAAPRGKPKPRNL